VTKQNIDLAAAREILRDFLAMTEACDARDLALADDPTAARAQVRRLARWLNLYARNPLNFTSALFVDDEPDGQVGM
jgi:hypothetical protein